MSGHRLLWVAMTWRQWCHPTAVTTGSRSGEQLVIHQGEGLHCAFIALHSKMLLGPVQSSFNFLPKHKANSYQWSVFCNCIYIIYGKPWVKIKFPEILIKLWINTLHFIWISSQVCEVILTTALCVYTQHNCLIIVTGLARINHVSAKNRVFAIS